MDWITILLGAVGKIVEQWVVADEAEKAAIEKRAWDAFSALKVDRTDTSVAHDARSKETEETLTRIANSKDVPTKP